MAVLFKIRNMSSSSTNKLYKISNKPSGDLPWWKEWLKTIGLFTKYQTLDDWLDHSSEALYEWQIRALMTRHISVDFLKAHFEEDTSDVNKIIFNNHINKWTTLRPYAYDNLSTISAVKNAMDAKGTYCGIYNYTKRDGAIIDWGLVNLIPRLDGNTNSPYGYAWALNPTSGHEAYHAFDDDEDTYFESPALPISNNQAQSILKYGNLASIDPRRVKIVAGPFTGTANIGIYIRDGSNDTNVYLASAIKVGSITLTNDGLEHYADLDYDSATKNTGGGFWSVFKKAYDWAYICQDCGVRCICLVYEGGNASSFAIKKFEVYGRRHEGNPMGNSLVFPTGELAPYYSNTTSYISYPKYFEYEFDKYEKNWHMAYDYGVCLSNDIEITNDSITYSGFKLSLPYSGGRFDIPRPTTNMKFNFSGGISSYTYSRKYGFALAYTNPSPTAPQTMKIMNADESSLYNCSLWYGRRAWLDILSEVFPSYYYNAYGIDSFIDFWQSMYSQYATQKYSYAILLNKNLRDKLIQYLLDDEERAKIFFNSINAIKILSSNKALLNHFKSYPSFKTIIDEAGLKYKDPNNRGIYAYGAIVSSSNSNQYNKSGITDNVPLIPKMSSTTSPYGEVISQVASAYSVEPWKVFAWSNEWQNTGVRLNSGWIGYKFNFPVNVTQVMLSGINNTSGSLFVSWAYIQYSNDGTNWTTVGDRIEFTNGRGYLSPVYISVPNNIYATMWRVKNAETATTCEISGLQFYGDSEEEDYFGLEDRGLYWYNNSAKYVMLYDNGIGLTINNVQTNTTSVYFPTTIGIDVTSFKKLKFFSRYISNGTTLKCGNKQIVYDESSMDSQYLELDISDLSGSSYELGVYNLPHPYTTTPCKIWLEK